MCVKKCMGDVSLSDRVLGCFAALAIGDAMGMPTESLPPDQIRKIYGYVRRFVRAHPTHPYHGLPAGRVTDDTEQAILMAQIIIENEGVITLERVINGLIKWAKKTNFKDKPFYGSNTKRALSMLLEGVRPPESGKLHTTCGGALRSPPIGIVNAGNPEKAAVEAAFAALPTHSARSAVSGASAIASAVSEAMSRESTIRSIVRAAIKGARIGFKYGEPIFSPSIPLRIKIASKVAMRTINPRRAISKIYHIFGTSSQAAEAVPAAIGVFVAARGDPMKAAELGANIGGDTDTIAALSASIAGAWTGTSKIDLELLETVEKVNKLEIRKIAKEMVELLKRRMDP